MSDRRTYRLMWPREITAADVTTALRALASSAGTPVTLDSLGISGHVEHRLHVSSGRAEAIVTELRTAIPGIGVEVIEPGQVPNFGLVLDRRLSTRRRSLRSDNATTTSRSLIGSLAHVGRDEAILLRWHLTDRLYPAAVASTTQSLPTDSVIDTLLAPFGPQRTIDAEGRAALRDKQREPGWRAVGSVAVQAASASRRQQLANAVLGALRAAKAPGVRVAARPTPPHHLPRPRRHGRIRINVSELAGIVGWPIGGISELPVVRIGSRRLPARRAIPTEGRVIGESTWPGSPPTYCDRRTRLTAPHPRHRSFWHGQVNRAPAPGAAGHTCRARPGGGGCQERPRGRHPRPHPQGTRG